MHRLINVRTILLTALTLSSIAVFRQNILTQLMVAFIAILLLMLQRDRRSLFGKLIGRIRHFWFAIVAIIILQILFRQDGAVYLSIWFVKVTDVGVMYGLSVGMRLINLILIAGLLFNISSSEYMLAFKAWRIPYEISFLVTTVIRFIPDYYRLFIAYRETMYLRNINLKELSIRNKLSALVSLLIPALTTNLADVKYRAIALDLKGFRYSKQRTNLYESKLKAHDYLIQFITLAGFVLLIVFIL
ncbi:MAG: energy-coupling factor transporter transmembrane protein EcfT [Candidatus Cloacimonetes bacterium]|nr:energy-coupling factor transporter transmembrane protein EcfT [Candidatus Cloacimonadota bacterium]